MHFFAAVEQSLFQKDRFLLLDFPYNVASLDFIKYESRMSLSVQIGSLHQRQDYDIGKLVLRKFIHIIWKYDRKIVVKSAIYLFTG